MIASKREYTCPRCTAKAEDIVANQYGIVNQKTYDEAKLSLQSMDGFGKLHEEVITSWVADELTITYVCTCDLCGWHVEKDFSAKEK